MQDNRKSKAMTSIVLDEIRSSDVQVRLEDVSCPGHEVCVDETGELKIVGELIQIHCQPGELNLT